MTTNTNTEAAAAANDGLPLLETPIEPVEIELPLEGGTPPAEPPKQPEAKTAEERKRGRPTNERIANLIGDKKQLMTELEEERRRSGELVQALQAREAELTQGQLRQMDLHKGRLSAEAQTARQLLKDARMAQDVDKETDATAKLARAESGLADVEAWEARNKMAGKAPPPPPTEQPDRQPQRPAIPPPDPATQSWMEDNPWFHPQSAEFDKAMHLTAVAYAARIENQLRAEGREKDIAGAEYWDRINEYMAKEFPDRFDAPEETPAPQARTSSPVAPATRSQPSTTQQLRGPNNGKVLMQLSSAERSMADNLRNSGALVYPANHPKAQANPQLRGKRMTAEDSYIAYGQQIRRDKADQVVRRANQQ